MGAVAALGVNLPYSIDKESILLDNTIKLTTVDELINYKNCIFSIEANDENKHIFTEQQLNTEFDIPGTIIHYINQPSIFIKDDEGKNHVIQINWIKNIYCYKNQGGGFRKKPKTKNNRKTRKYKKK